MDCAYGVCQGQCLGILQLPRHEFQGSAVEFDDNCFHPLTGVFRNLVSSHLSNRAGVVPKKDDALDPFAIIKATARQRYTENDINSAFAACWPVYQLRLGLTVSVRNRLLAAEVYCLKLLAQGQALATEISSWMGLPSHYVQYMFGNLIGKNLINISDSSSVVITPHGQNVLQQDGQTLQTKSQRKTVIYDPVCRCILLDTPRLLKSGEVEEAEEFRLPISVAKPTLDDLTSGQIRNAILEFQRGWAGADNTEDPDKPPSEEIVEVLHVDRIYKNETRLMYRADKVVVVMTPRAGHASQPELAVYQRYEDRFREGETNELQSLEPTWQDFVPTSLHPGNLRAGRQVQTSPSEEEMQVLNRQGDIEYDLTSHRLDIDSGIDTDFHRQCVRELDQQLKQLREIPNLERLTTVNHRPFLLKAIRETQHELVIVSAFINERAFDQEIRKLLVDAVCRRRAHVKIAWGLGTKGNPEADRIRTLGQKIQQQLEKQIRKTDASCLGLLQVKRLETHEKFIVCDDKYCAWGSFNWLSYRGEFDRGFRQESSTLSKRASDVELWCQRAKELFGES